MSQTDSGVRCIDALAAVSGCAEYVKLAVVHIDLHVHILCFRHNSHGCCGGMDPAAALCDRNALHAMSAAFVFQLGISPLAIDHEDHFLHAAKTHLVDGYQFRLPSVPLSKTVVHPVQFRCKKRCLIAAGAGTDLHDNVLIIILIFRKQEDLELALDRLHFFLCLRKFFLRQLF